MITPSVGSDKKGAGRPRKANDSLSVTVALRLTPSQAKLLKRTVQTTGKDTRHYLLQYVVKDAEALEPALVCQVKEELKQQYAPNARVKCPRCKRRAGNLVHVDGLTMHFECTSCQNTWRGEMKP